MRKKVAGSEPKNDVSPSVPHEVPLDDFKFLEEIIKNAYESSVTIPEAEKYAALFLAAQMNIAGKLKTSDLNARMRKSGVKAKRADVYMTCVNASDKKPAEGFLENHVNLDEGVRAEQKAFDEAEVDRDSLQTYLGIFKDAHIYFRGIAKGKFE